MMIAGLVTVSSTETRIFSVARLTWFMVPCQHVVCGFRHVGRDFLRPVERDLDLCQETRLLDSWCCVIVSNHKKGLGFRQPSTGKTPQTMLHMRLLLWNENVIEHIVWKELTNFVYHWGEKIAKLKLFHFELIFAN